MFICYKETDENGDRTRESLMAQEIYYNLTQQGRRVFFARITLEDKAGAQYEPYIFAALNSAKVMIVVGTSAENFNAVWVKNEWSRFLSLMRKDRTKLLLPCYRDMDPYDLPEQLSILQSYDMSKIGFLQDLLRGVGKGLDVDREPVRETVVVQGEASANQSALLRRGELALGDSDWSAADEFFDRTLDMDAECAEAYYGKFLARVKAGNFQQYVEAMLRQAKKGEKSCPKLASEMDEAHIAAAVERFEAIGYLSGKQIRQKYAPPKPYDSVQDYWQETAKRNQKSMEEDRDLQKARGFATGAFKESLEADVRAAVQRWDETVFQAQQRDAQAREAASKAYAQALEEGDRRVEELRRQVDAQREESYSELCEKQAGAKTSFDLRSCANGFVRLGDYKDSAGRAQQCRDLESRAREQERIEVARQYRKEQKQKIIRICLVFVAVLLVVAVVFLITKVILPGKQYREAEALLSQGDLSGAAEAFKAAGDFKDARVRSNEIDYTLAEELLAEGEEIAAAQAFAAIGDYADAQERSWKIYYPVAEELLAEGENVQAAQAFGAACGYENARERSFSLWDEIADRETISLGSLHAVGLKEDGTVIALGNNEYSQCNVDHWTDIIAVSAGDYHTVGLKADGTVVAVGKNSSNQCSVEDWTDIVAISAGEEHTVGLKADGTVVAIGNYDAEQSDSGPCDVTGWTGIVAVSAGDDYTLGLKSDGTVVAVGTNKDGQCEVEGWTDIVAISAGACHAVGLKADGTVVAAGADGYNQCVVEDWTDIVAISAGGFHTVGLRANKSVVAAGTDAYGSCVTEDWTGILAVSAGNDYTVGLKADGSVVATGFDNFGHYSVEGWTGIRHNRGALEIQAAHFAQGESLLAAGDCDGALAEFRLAGDYEGIDEAIERLHYTRAETRLAAGDRHGAAASFRAAGAYLDAAERAGDLYYALAQEYEATDNLKLAAICYGGATGHEGARERSAELWDDFAVHDTIAASVMVSLGVRTDGTVADTSWDGGDAGSWTDIIAVSADFSQVVGLKDDGTVVAAGGNDYGQCDVEEWTDIVAISSGGSYTAGLKLDGTVVTTGKCMSDPCNVKDWIDIVDVSAESNCIVGLRADGTVVAAGYNYMGKCNVEDWTDIVAISTGGAYTVGLKADGTIVAVGDNENGQCNVGRWTDIVAISAGSSHTLGLRSDGQVVAVGSNAWKQCNVADWTDILVRS